MSIYHNLLKKESLNKYCDNLKEFLPVNNVLKRQNELQKEKISLYLIEISEYRKEVRNMSNIKEELLLMNEVLKKKLSFLMQNSKGNKIHELDSNKLKETSELEKKYHVNENLIKAFELKEDKNDFIKEREQLKKTIEELDRSNNFYKLTLSSMESKFSKITFGYEEKINNLMKEIQALSKRIKEYDEINNDLNSPIKIINNLKSIIKENEDKLKQNEEKTNEIVDFNKHQKEEIGILGDQIRSLTEQISNLTKEKNRTDKDILNFHKLIDKHCTEYDECFQEKEIYKRKATILEKKIIFMENSLKIESQKERNSLINLKECYKPSEFPYSYRDNTNSLYNTPQSNKNFSNLPRKSYFSESKHLNLSFDSFQSHNIYQNNLNLRRYFFKINIPEKSRLSNFGIIKENKDKQEKNESNNCNSKLKGDINKINNQDLDRKNSIDVTNDHEEKIIIRIFKTLHRFNISWSLEEIENCFIN